ncbi:MAG: hypothetical protein OXF02_02940 [Simkaniaceae bacterium]|nr:hypothetical protein [Simkaniaceae bacterium]
MTQNVTNTLPEDGSGLLCAACAGHSEPVTVRFGGRALTSPENGSGPLHATVTGRLDLPLYVSVAGHLSLPENGSGLLCAERGHSVRVLLVSLAGGLSPMRDLSSGNNRLRMLPFETERLSGLDGLDIVSDSQCTEPLREVVELCRLREFDQALRQRMHAIDDRYEMLPEPEDASPPHPSHTWNDRPDTPRTGRIFFEVDPEDIARKPFAVLSRLRPYLDEGMLPIVRYTGSPGLDGGGLRRDFVTRLFIAMFPEGDDDVPRPRCGRDSPFDPSLCLLIGKLFGAAFLGEAGVVTGDLFHPLLFEMIGVPDEKEIRKMGEAHEPIGYEIVDKFLSVYMGGTLRNSGRETIALRKEALSCLLGGGSNKFLHISPESKKMHGYETDQRITKKQFLDELDNGQFREFLLAVRSIIKGMHDYVGERHRRRLVEHAKKGELRGMVEGRLSTERVRSALRTNNPNARVFRYLQRWIRESDEDKVRDFLQCITGLRTLPWRDPQLHIKVHTPESTQDPTPRFDTCARRMQLRDYVVEEGKVEEGYRYFTKEILEPCIAPGGKRTDFTLA